MSAVVMMIAVIYGQFTHAGMLTLHHSLSNWPLAQLLLHAYVSMAVITPVCRRHLHIWPYHSVPQSLLFLQSLQGPSHRL